MQLPLEKMNALPDYALRVTETKIQDGYSVDIESEVYTPTPTP